MHILWDPVVWPFGAPVWGLWASSAGPSWEPNILGCTPDLHNQAFHGDKLLK